MSSQSSIDDPLPPLRWVLIRWEQLFFSGASASELGVHRLLFFGLVLLYSFSPPIDPAAWAGVSRVFWSPTYFFSFFEFPVPSEATLIAMTWAWRAALCLTMLGLFTRLSSLLAFGLGAYLLGLPQNFGKVHHNDAILVIGLAIFALSRCGDGWSLDSLRRAAARVRANAAGELAATVGEHPWGGEYSWPLRLCRLMSTLVVFAAGVAKLRDAGLAWIFSDNIYYTILRHHYTHEPFSNVGFLFTSYPWLCNAVAGITMVVELSAPLLVLLRGRWRLLLLAFVVAMMLGFGLTLGVLFSHYVAMLVIFFLPWSTLGAWFARRGSTPRLELLYDGSCGLCNRTIALVRRLDVLGCVQVHDVLQEWGQLSVRFPDLDRAACLATMHVIREDGRVFAGFQAYRALARVLPLGWLFLGLLYFPGVPLLGERVYAFVARGRHATACHREG